MDWGALGEFGGVLGVITDLGDLRGSGGVCGAIGACHEFGEL